MPIFKQFHKFVIGKGGATIKQIRQDTNAKVDLPASGSDSDIILLTGRKDDVLKAQKIIQQIQSEQADVVSTTIPRDVIEVFAVSILPHQGFFLALILIFKFLGQLRHHNSCQNT